MAYSLISNHPFLDGNKRIGQMAMEAFLLRNGYEIDASTDAQEAMILSIAAGESDRETLWQWLAVNVREAGS